MQDPISTKSPPATEAGVGQYKLVVRGYAVLYTEPIHCLHQINPPRLQLSVHTPSRISLDPDIDARHLDFSPLETLDYHEQACALVTPLKLI